MFSTAKVLCYIYGILFLKDGAHTTIQLQISVVCDFHWITKILFVKIYSQNTWLVNEEFSVLGTNNS